MRKLTITLFLSCVGLFGQSDLKPGFDANAIDKSADPCGDFFQYACGNWIKANPIPGDQTSWGRFNALVERNRSILKDILETSSFKKTRTPVEQKIGDYYDSCLDTKAIEAKGTAPLKAPFKEIESIQNKAGLVDEVAKLHREGVPAFFRVGAGE